MLIIIYCRWASIKHRGKTFFHRASTIHQPVAITYLRDNTPNKLDKLNFKRFSLIFLLLESFNALNISEQLKFIFVLKEFFLFSFNTNWTEFFMNWTERQIPFIYHKFVTRIINRNYKLIISLQQNAHAALQLASTFIFLVNRKKNSEKLISLTIR